MILQFISSLFGPVSDLISKVISKDEDKTKALAELQNVQSKMIDTLSKLESEKYELMKAETNSTNWLAQAWRPISSLLIVLVVVAVSLIGFWKTGKLDEHFWDLANVFLGIYGSSRGLEKITAIVRSK